MTGRRLIAYTPGVIGATANPAWVLGIDDRVGTLEPGKRADLVLLDGPSFAHVPYRPGHNPVTATVIGGEPIAS